jgi:hypothetical protein
MGGMATKERVIQLIDSLPDTPETELRLDSVVHELEPNGAGDEHDPLLRAIANAPEDDEPWTDEDEAAMAEVRADEAAGVPRISHEEMLRKYG